MVLSISRLVCQFPGCNRVFKNKSGLTKHTRTQHLLPPQARQHVNPMVAGPGCIPLRERSPTPADGNLDIDGNPQVGNEDYNQENPGFVPEEGTWVDMGRLFRVFHPKLTGTGIIYYTLRSMSVNLFRMIQDSNVMLMAHLLTKIRNPCFVVQMHHQLTGHLMETESNLRRPSFYSRAIKCQLSRSTRFLICGPPPS